MSARTDRPPYKPGDVIGRVYRIVKVLAEGGFSVIYEAVDVTVDRTVAVKVLRPHIARVRSYSREQMRRECQVLVKLHEITPYVVDVLTAGITEDRHALPYFVMERLRGSTLRQSIVEKQRRGEAYSIEEVLSFGITIAMALVRAHGLDVAHRDLKPENVFMALGHNGDVVLKLLDFGICIDVTTESEMSEQGRFTCSLPYAAPEQVEGRRATTATDVYTLGLLLVELLTLRLPHGRDVGGLTPERLELALADEPVPDPNALRPDTPRRLARLVSRCLTLTPMSRPSAHDVARDLRDTKLEMEGKLGAQESSTDVDEPTIEELHRRMAAASSDRTARMRVVAGVGPVDLHAATEPPSPSHVGEEVFFVRATPPRAGPVVDGVAPEGVGQAPVSASAEVTSPSGPPDVTLPDPVPAFAAAPAVTAQSAIARIQPDAILPMPVISIRETPAPPHPQPDGGRAADTLYVDPDEALRMLGRAHGAASTPNRSDELSRPLGFVNSGLGPGPRAALSVASGRAPLARAEAIPYDNHPSQASPQSRAARSEPGPWQTATQAPPRRGPRERALIGLALAAPVLVALALVPLLHRGTHAPSQAQAASAPDAPSSASLLPAPPPPVPLPPPDMQASAPPAIVPPAARPSARAAYPGARSPKPTAGTSARTDPRSEFKHQDDPFFKGP